eukprot:1157414-Pelagomonas_calceolata.AAC.5
MECSCPYQGQCAMIRDGLLGLSVGQKRFNEPFEGLLGPLYSLLSQMRNPPTLLTLALTHIYAAIGKQVYLLCGSYGRIRYTRQPPLLNSSQKHSCKSTPGQYINDSINLCDIDLIFKFVDTDVRWQELFGKCRRSLMLTRMGSVREQEKLQRHLQFSTAFDQVLQTTLLRTSLTWGSRSPQTFASFLTESPSPESPSTETPSTEAPSTGHILITDNFTADHTHMGQSPSTGLCFTSPTSAGGPAKQITKLTTHSEEGKHKFA